MTKKLNKNLRVTAAPDDELDRIKAKALLAPSLQAGARVKAINAEYMRNLEAYLKLALRAQSQACRTWEAVSAIKNPPIANYVRQANIAGGHQQVNNNGSHTRETEKTPTKLLEKTNGQRLDLGAQSTASGANPAMETVGEEHRTDDASG